jgi:hypothetical protein
MKKNTGYPLLISTIVILKTIAINTYFKLNYCHSIKKTNIHNTYVKYPEDTNTLKSSAVANNYKSLTINRVTPHKVALRWPAGRSLEESY